MTSARKEQFQKRFNSLVRQYVNEHEFGGKDVQITMGNLFIKIRGPRKDKEGIWCTDLGLGYGDRNA